MVEKNKKIFKNILNGFSIFILLIIWFAIFINYEFNDVSFEQLIFTLTNPAGANYDIVWYGILFVGLGVFFTIIIYKLFKYIWNYIKLSVVFKFRFKKKEISVDLFKVTRFRKIIFYLIFVFGSIYGAIKLVELDSYLKNMNNVSTIFEDYYVDGSKVKIEFPKKKRNLIFLVVESLESSNVSKKNGGLVDESYSPYLEKLAMEYTNFSSSDKIGGLIQVSNTSYTIAGLVSHTSGIPLKTPVDWNTYKSNKSSLSGAYSMGEILEHNGYKNYFMLGSDADYGGRKQYFEQHGNYEIFDYYWAIKERKISNDYKVWWGYEDLKLYDYAKEKLLEISKNDEPFNFTMLTADTHFTDGYMDKYCENKFSNVYANSFYCADYKIGKFIEWVKKQEFYKDTTIVIVGDHLVVQDGLYDDMSNRYIYNVIINSSLKTDNNKNRIATHFDMYPTTLAALGAKIDGDKLGLGVNLYSDKDTLIEELGVDYINAELLKKSNYYDNHIIGDDYYDMINNKEELYEDK